MVGKLVSTVDELRSSPDLQLYGFIQGHGEGSTVGGTQSR